MAKYGQTATSVQSHVDYVMQNIADKASSPETEQALKNEVLFHLACIMNLGFRCNPRPAQGVIRKNALEIALHQTFNQSWINYGKPLRWNYVSSIGR